MGWIKRNKYNVTDWSGVALLIGGVLMFIPISVFEFHEKFQGVPVWIWFIPILPIGIGIYLLHALDAFIAKMGHIVDKFTKK